MRFWHSLYTRRLQDFADAIRPELREITAPRAGEELLARIIASRAAGARVILPHADAARPAPLMRYATAAIAAVVIIGIASRIVARDDRATDLAAPPSFWFASAAAAQPTLVSVSPVRVTTPERMYAFSARYARTARTPDGTTTTNAHTDVRVERDPARGEATWRIVSARTTVADGHRAVDTVRIAAADLRVLSVVAWEAPHRSYAKVTVAQRMEGLRLFGTMDAERASGPGAHREFDRQLPAALAPYVPDAIAPIYLMGVQIGAGWQGRLSLLGWAVRDNDVSVPLDMRVDGEETVRVPAGRFECWRIALDVGGTRQWYWVRKSDGLGIRALRDTRDGASHEILLVSQVRS